MAAAFGVIACAAVFYCYGVSAEAFELAAFAALLAVVSAVDMESRRIPNVLVAACALVRVAYLGWLYASGFAAADRVALHSCLGAVAVGIGLLLVSSAVSFARGRDGLGGGDVKLLAVAALYFGMTGGLAVTAVACVLALVGQAVPLSKNSGEPDLLSRTFPFGPFIALACVFVMLAASPAVSRIIF